MKSIQAKVLCVALGAVLWSGASQAARAQVETTPYAIAPGSAYTYFPSGFGPGHPGCDPNDYQCDYVIAGTFSLEEDFDAGTAVITGADLTLIGNEAVSGLGLTTADRVEDWLENQDLVLLPAAFPGRAYAASLGTFGEGFSIVVLGDEASLTGGYNNQPVDGDAIEFRVTAHAVPEPAAIALLMVAGGLASGWRRDYVPVYCSA